MKVGEIQLEMLSNFGEIQEQHWPTIADGLDMIPMYHYWWDVLHNTGKASKQTASMIIERFSNLNPYFKMWNDFWMNSLSLDPNFLRDYIVNGWYIPGYS